MTVPPDTGPEAILHALKNYDMEGVEAAARTDLRSGKVSKQKGAVQKLNAINGLRRNNLKPEQYMVTKVPVVPPVFRPFSAMGSAFVPGDANELYRDLIDMRNVYSDAETMFGRGNSGDNYLQMYDAAKAVYGYGDPVKPKTAQRGVSGFMQQLTGTNPKFSFVQRKLISKPHDSVSRGVAVVDPDLHLDEIGVPENMLWTTFAPYIQRRLVRAGMRPVEAVRQIQERTVHADRMLKAELKERPVIYSRAPAWHKFNVIAAWARPVKGDNIATNPLITTGQNLDYDGDTLNLHVPASQEAVHEAIHKLMPSKMLFSIRSHDKVVPALKHEQVLSLFAANHRPSRQVHAFPNREAALKAIQAGDVSLQDEIEVPD